MFEIRSHVRGTDTLLALTFHAGVLEVFAAGASLGRFHVHGIDRLDLAVDRHADVDLQLELSDGTTHAFALPAEARPDAQLLIASVERERSALAL
ncbi:MAG TPA: hypothetical protein VFZ83_11490 [Acidimicrobiia bacterium]|nr:hypothetical protein [Acidimicrobiia bacterium]